jgi:hypothetical protein
MRVTFPRLPDYSKAYSIIERDDGVVYRLYSGVAGHGLPHDIRHFVVERELDIRDGLWGGIAAGAVFRSMRHVRGRRPPHAAPRPLEPKREFRAHALRAEMIANLVESVAALDAPTPAEIRRLAGVRLSVLPDASAVSDVDPEAIAAAARALQVEAARWARLRPGQELVYEWPTTPRIPRQRGPR